MIYAGVSPVGAGFKPALAKAAYSMTLIEGAIVVVRTVKK
jgi:hypothetical protein